MPADIDSPEDLRQAIASLEWENARLRGEVHQAHQLLNGLEALHATRIGDDPFECVFDSLCAVFDFTEAMVLAESDTDELRCVVAEPDHLRGAPWPVGPFFRKVMDGAVTSVFCHDGIAEWRGARDLSLSVDQPALYIPLRVHDRRGVLVLLRAWRWANGSPSSPRSPSRHWMPVSSSMKAPRGRRRRKPPTAPRTCSSPISATSCARR
jgi:hypothetical protein